LATRFVSPRSMPADKPTTSGSFEAGPSDEGQFTG
jgi:hypothetical protein